MSAKFQITMTQKDIFDFMIYHAYTHVSGILGVVIGVVCLALGVTQFQQGSELIAAAEWFLALAFLVYTPFSLWHKSGEQLKKTEMFREPISYEVNENGVAAGQGKNRQQYPWNSFYKAVSTNQALIIYMSKAQTLILPIGQLGENYAAVVQVISTNMPPDKVKIRRVS